MKITAEIYGLLYDNPNGDGYIPREDLTETQLKELKELNEEHKKLYGTDLIFFECVN